MVGNSNCKDVYGDCVECAITDVFVPALPLPPPPFVLAVDVTSVVQRRIFIQGKKRRIEQHRVVVLHDDPLVLRLDPWLVLIG